MEHQRKQSIEQHITPRQPIPTTEPQSPIDDIGTVRTALISPATDAGAPPLQPSAVLYLQRTIGNRAVQRMLSGSAQPINQRAKRGAVQRAGGDELAPPEKVAMVEATEKTGQMPAALPIPACSAADAAAPVGVPPAAAPAPKPTPEDEHRERVYGASREGVGSFHARASGARWARRGDRAEWAADIRPDSPEAAEASSLGEDSGTFKGVGLGVHYDAAGERTAPEVRVGSSTLKQATWTDDGKKVKYITDPAERASYELKLNMASKKFYWRGKLMDTSDFHATTNDLMNVGTNVVIFVMTTGGKIYVADEGTEAALGEMETSGLQWRFNHSSILAGEAIATAGEMKFVNGVLVTVSNSSGHYQPNTETIVAMLRHLQRSGLDISQVEVVLEDWEKRHMTGQAALDFFDHRTAEQEDKARRQHEARQKGQKTLAPSQLSDLRQSDPQDYKEEMSALRAQKDKIAAALAQVSTSAAGEGTSPSVPALNPRQQVVANRSWLTLSSAARQLFIEAVSPAAPDKTMKFKMLPVQEAKVQALFIATIAASLPKAPPTATAPAAAPKPAAAAVT